MKTEAIEALITTCERLNNTISGVLHDEGIEDKAAIVDARAELDALLAEIERLRFHNGPAEGGEG
jgi:uncharacterized protein YPO0396